MGCKKSSVNNEYDKENNPQKYPRHADGSEAATAIFCVYCPIAWDLPRFKQVVVSAIYVGFTLQFFFLRILDGRKSVNLLEGRILAPSITRILPEYSLQAL